MFSFSSIEQYQAQLNEGRLSCVQTVEHYLAAIEGSRHLNAYLEVFGEEALQRAAELDAQHATGRKGKLHGVVIGIKDLICYKDHKVSASSKILENFTSLFSATAVERLLAEGAIIIGRQNCDEFGMGSTNENSAYGPTLNPVDESVVPGGSSGGSAAAVKAGLCMASLGTDTGGSVRLPSDFCGTVGFKPSYGRVSRYGLIAYASSFDQIGVIAENVADVAAVLEVVSGPDNFDSTVAQQPVDAYAAALKEETPKYRIAYFPEWFEHPSVDPEIAAQLKSQLEALEAQGHTVAPVHFSLTEYIVPTYYILTTAEASSNLSRFDGVRYGYSSKAPVADLREFYKKNRSEGFGKEVKRRIMLGTFVLSHGYYDAYFTKAQQVRRLLQEQTDLIFKDFDILLAPNSPHTAFKTGEAVKDPVAMYMGDIFTVFANLTGVPAVSLPLFRHNNGLPYGLQAMSNRFNDVSLLSFSHQLMLV
ncbi:Asp-tRNA(Asn)/Glu-tRNA(Gln) amidotransferase subunit GatA [Paraflavisolibacter sp. H34]|uniref:Asp-tRNA(Asn)/Glu-tRNA(Gln) amidotransferase subunit GatA n=1 Tax=Huijunlia imazamoxiresistens TaxID=3127457 RepID=UPI003018D52D